MMPMTPADSFAESFVRADLPRAEGGRRDGETFHLPDPPPALGEEAGASVSSPSPPPDRDGGERRGPGDPSPAEDLVGVEEAGGDPDPAVESPRTTSEARPARGEGTGFGGDAPTGESPWRRGTPEMPWRRDRPPGDGGPGGEPERSFPAAEARRASAVGREGPAAAGPQARPVHAWAGLAADRGRVRAAAHPSAEPAGQPTPDNAAGAGRQRSAVNEAAVNEAAGAGRPRSAAEPSRLADTAPGEAPRTRPVAATVHAGPRPSAPGRGAAPESAEALSAHIRQDGPPPTDREGRPAIAFERREFSGLDQLRIHVRNTRGPEAAIDPRQAALRPASSWTLTSRFGGRFTPPAGDIAAGSARSPEAGGGPPVAAGPVADPGPGARILAGRGIDPHVAGREAAAADPRTLRPYQEQAGPAPIQGPSQVSQAIRTGRSLAEVVAAPVGGEADLYRAPAGDRSRGEARSAASPRSGPGPVPHSLQPSDGPPAEQAERGGWAELRAASASHRPPPTPAEPQAPVPRPAAADGSTLSEWGGEARSGAPGSPAAPGAPETAGSPAQTLLNAQQRLLEAIRAGLSRMQETNRLEAKLSLRIQDMGQVQIRVSEEGTALRVAIHSDAMGRWVEPEGLRDQVQKALSGLGYSGVSVHVGERDHPGRQSPGSDPDAPAGEVDDVRLPDDEEEEGQN